MIPYLHRMIAPRYATVSALLFAWLAIWAANCQPAQSPPAAKPPEAETSYPAPDSFVYDLAYITGRFEPENHPLFVAIDPAFASRPGMYMHRDAYRAFQAMYEAARRDGINLRIVSATRNFRRQKEIWEAKWEGRTLVEEDVNLHHSVPDPVERARRILRFSSMPGTSRHHWGTDIDLNQLENGWFEKGEGRLVYQWLQQNAGAYGFGQPYTPKGERRPHGYEEEKWHWSWLPLAGRLTRQAAEQITDEDIRGFAGDDTARKLDIVHHYILGVDPSCR